VAFAGPAVNILIALIFGLLVRFSGDIGITSLAFLQLAAITAYINILLALFNLIPVPPLDGSKVLSAVLPYRYSQVFDRFQEWMARFGILAMFGFIAVFILVFAGPFFALVQILFEVVAGAPLGNLL
jgi:Zn-dependent protease